MPWFPAGGLQQYSALSPVAGTDGRAAVASTCRAGTQWIPRAASARSALARSTQCRATVRGHCTFTGRERGAGRSRWSQLRGGGGRVTLLTTAALVAAWRRRGTSPRFRPTQLLAVALGVSEATVQRRCGLLLKSSPSRVVQRVTGAWVVALVERGMTVTAAARLLGLARPASVYPLVRLAFGCSLRHLRSRSGGAFTDSGGDCGD